MMEKLRLLDKQILREVATKRSALHEMLMGGEMKGY